MTYTDLEQHRQNQPFRPFTIYMSDGSKFEVRHPEMLILGRTELVVGLSDGSENGSGPLADRMVHLSIRQITRVEPTPIAS